jgi:hypothetical protein
VGAQGRREWVVGQSEYATDVMFKNRAALNNLYPRLISHCLRCFGAREISFAHRRFRKVGRGGMIAHRAGTTFPHSAGGAQ